MIQIQVPQYSQTFLLNVLILGVLLLLLTYLVHRWITWYYKRKKEIKNRKQN